jgi:hypothetical protein
LDAPGLAAVPEKSRGLPKPLRRARRETPSIEHKSAWQFTMRRNVDSGSLAARPDRRRLETAPELPHGLEEFLVDGVPEPATVEVGARLPDGCHELSGPHLGDDLGQLSKGDE